MKTFLRLSLVVLVSFSLALTGCKKNDPEPVNEQEEINRIDIKFTPRGGGQAVTFRFVDADGPGGNPPVFTTAPLRAGVTYDAKIEVYFVGPDGVTIQEDITEEIEEEDDEHQFFFIINPASLMTHAYSDTDRNGRPLGLRNTFTTASAGSGTLRVVLRHDLNKAFAGLNASNFQQAGGETDLDVTFNVTVQQ
jgi:hypothetical protein